MNKAVKKQSGLAVGILIAVMSLLSIAAISSLRSYSNIDVVKTTNQIAYDLKSQASLIAYRLNMCSLVYNDTANGLDQFPAGTAAAVSGLVCPNSPYSTIWAEPDGVRLQPPPSGFGEWSYTKDVAGSTVSFSTTASSDIAKKALALSSGTIGGNHTILADTLTIYVFQ